MKSIFFICFSFLLIQGIHAQEALKTFTDIAASKTYAVENNQNILMVFAGSDWCKPCIQFKKDILQSNDFIDRLGNQVNVLYLDFPARRKNKLSKEQTAHNENLAERFNKSGAFPKIVLIDKDEKVLATPSFNGQTALDFIHELSPSITVQK